ncbi:hypothetical protein [Gordonia iterans]
MRKFMRIAMSVAAGSAIATGMLAGAGETSAEPTAQQKAEPFPYLYSNVRSAPTTDQNGNPSPWNDVVWDHATVLTRSQTAVVRDSGALPIVAGTNIRPYSSLAKSAQKTLSIPSERARVTSGGCLALYWSDKDFRGPDGNTTLVGTQVLGRAACRP